MNQLYTTKVAINTQVALDAIQVQAPVNTVCAQP